MPAATAPTNAPIVPNAAVAGTRMSWIFRGSRNAIEACPPRNVFLTWTNEVVHRSQAMSNDAIRLLAFCSLGKEIRKAVAYLRTSSRTNVGADKDSDKRQRAPIEESLPQSPGRPPAGTLRPWRGHSWRLNTRGAPRSGLLLGLGVMTIPSRRQRRLVARCGCGLKSLPVMEKAKATGRSCSTPFEYEM